jgi:hypothetical protein
MRLTVPEEGSEGVKGTVISVCIELVETLLLDREALDTVLL